jgi:hypothetical protein
VASFDRGSGLGTVTSGGIHFPFHATSIADGSRDIEPLATVAFTVIHRSGGRREAGDLNRVG